MANITNDNFYWDYVSVNASKNTDCNDSFKTLIKDSFLDIFVYIDQLYWVNAVVLYLNAYIGISQVKISKLLGISQFGVSKRYQSSKNKLKFIMSKPIQDRNKITSILTMLLSHKHYSPLIVFYSFNLMSMMYKVINSVGTVKIDNNFNAAMIVLESYANATNEEEFYRIMKVELGVVHLGIHWEDYKLDAGRLINFFKSTRQQCLYGNYLFKANDKIGRSDFDKKCLFE